MICCGICGQRKEEEPVQHFEHRGSIICTIIRDDYSESCKMCTKGCMIIMCKECSDKLKKIGEKKK